MEIKILGPGCPKCRTLEKITYLALNELGVEARVEKVEDIVKIMSYNIFYTPALVINEKVVVSGQVPSVNKIKEIISNHL